MRMCLMASRMNAACTGASGCMRIDLQCGMSFCMTTAVVRMHTSAATSLGCIESSRFSALSSSRTACVWSYMMRSFVGIATASSNVVELTNDEAAVPNA